MRTLFLKIFVWFWLAMALVVVAHSLSTMAVFDERPRRMLQGEFTMIGLTVTEKYEREGQAGADAYLSLLERTNRTRAYLFDENGAELAGSEAPPRVKEMAESLAAGEDFRFTQTARIDYVAKRVDGLSGGLLVEISLPVTPR